MSSYPYLANDSNNQMMNADLVQELLSKQSKVDKERNLKNAIHNPKDGFIYLEKPEYGQVENSSTTNPIRWDQFPKVYDTKRALELEAKSAAGKQHANEDQVRYGPYRPEWQDEAARCDSFIEAHGAGVITSTEFPAITVTTVSNELLRNDLIVAQKYNLLGITTTINTDQLWVIYPEYSDTGKKVRSGLQEGDAIDTVGPGAFTETRIGLEKSGVGIAFTEEFYMRQFTYPITQFLLEAIANDFARVKHDRLIALLPTFADVTGADWFAYTAGNLQSTNRPAVDLNAARQQVHAADKLASVNTIVSSETQLVDYETNTWVRGLMQPIAASNRDFNGVITNPVGIPWAQRWYVNEDIAANKAFVFDNRAFVMIQGPRKTTQFQLYNPDQTVTMQKDWFKQHLRKSAWGRELVSI
jgi:hypothetical protein